MTGEKTVDFKVLRDILKSQSAIAGDTADRAVQALTRFLDGQAMSLDAAFGLIAPNHRPKDDSRVDIAREVHKLRKAGKTWQKIADEFAAAGRRPADEKSLRDLCKEFAGQLTSDEVISRLAGDQ